MRYVKVPMLIIFLAVFVSAQDGSDIKYLKPDQLDDSLIGRAVQIDFYRRSFFIFYDGESARPLDKVTLEINGKQVEFIEHREDDGYNNWLSRQYLESADQKIKIKEFKLLKIEIGSITVLAQFNVAPFTKEFTFSRKDIAEILVKWKW